MFMNPRRFIKLFAGFFFASAVKPVQTELADTRGRDQGKGKGRRTPPVRNAAIHKRAAKKAKGRATNKARHAA